MQISLYVLCLFIELSLRFIFGMVGWKKLFKFLVKVCSSESKFKMSVISALLFCFKDFHFTNPIPNSVIGTKAGDQIS